MTPVMMLIVIAENAQEDVSSSCTGYLNTRSRLLRWFEKAPVEKIEARKDLEKGELV